MNPRKPMVIAVPMSGVATEKINPSLPTQPQKVAETFTIVGSQELVVLPSIHNIHLMEQHYATRISTVTFMNSCACTVTSTTSELE